MKVNALLDDIFFGKGSLDFLPIAKQFAGNDDAEIFGISMNYMDDTTRVLITMPVEESKGSKLGIYLGSTNGSFARIGNDTYTRDEALAVYSMIMASKDLEKIASESNITRAAELLDGHMQVSLLAARRKAALKGDENQKQQ